jgi:radical SAM protein with 4Fe4S-binding SPASM domain
VLDEYTRFVEYLMSLPDELFLDCVLRLSPSDFFRRFIDRLIARSARAYRCPALQAEISIDTDGRIYPCGSFTGLAEWCIGNINDGIDEKRFYAFHGDAHVDNRVGCRDCWARYLCGGGCYYNSAIVNGSMFSPDSVKCRLVKHIIELAMIFTGHLHGRGESVLSILGYREQNDARHYDCRYSDVMASLSRPLSTEAQAMNLDEGNMIRKKAWRGPTDLSAEIRIWWNEQGFSLQADVTDDIFFEPFDMTWFNAGDCLRFVLQNPETGRLHEFGAALLSSGPGIFRTINGGLAKPVESALVDIERSGDKTRYAVMIPWAEMEGAPSADDTWPFALVIVDHDRTSSGWMQWSPGLMPRVNGQAMGKITFHR